jgi:hypothetical protein
MTLLSALETFIEQATNGFTTSAVELEDAIREIVREEIEAGVYSWAIQKPNDVPIHVQSIPDISKRLELMANAKKAQQDTHAVAVFDRQEQEVIFVGNLPKYYSDTDIIRYAVTKSMAAAGQPFDPDKRDYYNTGTETISFNEYLERGEHLTEHGFLVIYEQRNK